MTLIKTRLVNHKFTAITILVLLFGITLAYAQYSSIGNMDEEDRLEIAEKAEVIKNVNITDTLEMSEKTELLSIISQSSK